jgi:hypothetical protein
MFGVPEFSNFIQLLYLYLYNIIYIYLYKYTHSYGLTRIKTHISKIDPRP